MKITEDGFFEFDNYLYVKKMYQVVEDSMILGEVNLEFPLYLQWYKEYAEPKGIKNNIVTWSIVFIPNLEYSIIKFQCDMLDRNNVV